MSEVMGTFGHMTLHAGPDAWVRCGTYTNGPLPNLSVSGGGLTMTLYLAGEARFAGKRRDHVPTVDEPFVVVLVDEVAFLTAYQRDRRRSCEGRAGSPVH